MLRSVSVTSVTSVTRCHVSQYDGDNTEDTRGNNQEPGPGHTVTL